MHKKVFLLRLKARTGQTWHNYLKFQGSSFPTLLFCDNWTCIFQELPGLNPRWQLFSRRALNTSLTPAVFEACRGMSSSHTLNKPNWVPPISTNCQSSLQMSRSKDKSSRLGTINKWSLYLDASGPFSPPIKSCHPDLIRWWANFKLSSVWLDSVYFISGHIRRRLKKEKVSTNWLIRKQKKKICQAYTHPPCTHPHIHIIQPRRD